MIRIIKGSKLEKAKILKMIELREQVDLPASGFEYHPGVFPGYPGKVRELCCALSREFCKRLMQPDIKFLKRLDLCVIQLTLFRQVNQSNMLYLGIFAYRNE